MSQDTQVSFEAVGDSESGDGGGDRVRHRRRRHRDRDLHGPGSVGAW